MAITLKTTKDFGKDAGVKVLVYGRPGAGKTRLCATAPNPIVLSAESGLLSLSGTDIPYIQISSIEDLNEAYAWLIGSDEAAAFRTICLDSVSEIAEQVLSQEKGKTADGRKAYGEMQERVTRLLRTFRDIPGKNVYFSAKMEKNQNEDGLMLYQPSLPGSKLSQNIGYFFDEEFVLTSVKNEDGTLLRVLQTSGDTSYEAKDRSGRLAFYEAPDLGAIFSKISGGEDAKA